MGQPFNNSGVNGVQSDVLSLPVNERSLVTNMIRNNFNGWMLSTFDLRPSQVDQLHEMPVVLRDEIATDLADSWDDGVMVNFHKEEIGDDDDRGPKEIIHFRRVATGAGTQHQAAGGHTIAQMSITIRYR